MVNLTGKVRLARWTVAVGVLVSACPSSAPRDAGTFFPRCATASDCGSSYYFQCVDGSCLGKLTVGCEPGERIACGSDVGQCRKGVRQCPDGVIAGPCEGAVGPVSEMCNGLDDDCDGVIDDGVTAAFFADRDGDGFGAAQTTVEACAVPAGFVSSSADCDDTSADVAPGRPEVCDGSGRDENCDSTIDEGCSCTSGTATSPCCGGRGVHACEREDGGDSLSACFAAIAMERCNGLDDDCDGVVDDGPFDVPLDGGFAGVDGGLMALPDGGCVSGIGACASRGQWRCRDGELRCSATTNPPTVETCNGIDDDCDGEVDEGRPCPNDGFCIDARCR